VGFLGWGVLGRQGVFLDEVAPWFNGIAHESM